MKRYLKSVALLAIGFIVGHNTYFVKNEEENDYTVTTAFRFKKKSKNEDEF